MLSLDHSLMIIEEKKEKKHYKKHKHYHKKEEEIVDNLEREQNLLRGLKQYKGISLEELLIHAKKSLEKKEILSGLTGYLPEEKLLVTRLLENHLKDFSLSSSEEKEILGQLIYEEILLERVKVYINKETERANPVPPIQMLEQKTSLQNRIEKLKIKLRKPEVKQEIVSSTVVIKGYPKEFSDKLKEKIHKRDNYICQFPDCEITQEEHFQVFHTKLNAHHIDYDKNNNNEKNLITLCFGHNRLVKTDKEHWIKSFQKMIEIIYEQDSKKK